MELNLAVVHEAIAEAVPDRPCILWRDRRLTWSDVTDRTRRLANVLGQAGLGIHGSRHDRPGWVSPHDHVALYLTNGNEYLEGMLGAAKARAAAVNINYRYVADELAYVLDDAGAAAIMYHGRYAQTLAEVLPRLRRAPLLLRVDDGSGDALLPGAVDYEAALAAASADRPDLEWSPDDLYVLYTGGTTGSPKGVLWRQADFLVAALGVRRRDGTDHQSLDELVEPARHRRLRALPAPPFMHGAAHWNALSAWISGGTVVIQDDPSGFDPADVLATCARHEVSSLLIVGDAFARPLVDELATGTYDLTAMRFLLTGGAILSASVKAELLAALPHVRIVDVLGSSETGRQGTQTSAGATGVAAGFERSAATVVLSDDRRRRLRPGDPEIGWLAQGGRVPLGYLGDEAKTRATFPEVDGERVAVAGDRVRWLADGRLELHGRESVTINSGGEKIFAEEVEAALKHHPSVYDALVVGRPSERWGQEVVAVVALRAGHDPDADAIRQAAGAHLARYKLPKVFVFRDQVQRSPSGKPDYGWAREQVDGAGAR
ncbi:MAG: fatty-acid--CoA ligase [Acidimicrobiales bacterium]|nr:fatty-acid--CoA ligase [Acidimicrobiales bacterium]